MERVGGTGIRQGNNDLLNGQMDAPAQSSHSRPQTLTHILEKQAKGSADRKVGISNAIAQTIALFGSARPGEVLSLTKEQTQNYLAPNLGNLGASLLFKNTPWTSALLQDKALRSCLDQPIPGYGGKTALCIAVHTLNFPVIKMLLEAGADVNQADEQGLHPLVRLITTVNTENASTCRKILKFLSEKGANPDAPLPASHHYIHPETKEKITTIRQYSNYYQNNPSYFEGLFDQPAATVVSIIETLLQRINEFRQLSVAPEKNPHQKDLLESNKCERQRLEKRLFSGFSDADFVPKKVEVRPSHFALYAVIEAVGQSQATLAVENVEPSPQPALGETQSDAVMSHAQVLKAWLPLVPKILSTYNISHLIDRLPDHLWQSVLKTQCPELLEALLSSGTPNEPFLEEQMKRCMNSNQSPLLLKVLKNAHDKIPPTSLAKSLDSNPLASLESRLLNHALHLDILNSQWEDWQGQGVFTQQHLMTLIHHLAHSPERLDKAGLNADQLQPLCLTLKDLSWNASTLKNLLDWGLRHQSSGFCDQVIQVCRQQHFEVQLEVLERIVKENNPKLIACAFSAIAKPWIDDRSDLEKMFEWINARSLKQLKPPALATFLQHLSKTTSEDEWAALDEQEDESLVWWAVEQNLERVVEGMTDQHSLWFAQLQAPDLTGFTPFQAVLKNGNIPLALRLAQTPDFRLTQMDCDAALGQGEHHENWKALYAVEVATSADNALTRYLRQSQHEIFATRFALAQGKDFNTKLAMLINTPLNIALRDLSQSWAHDPAMLMLLEICVAPALLACYQQAANQVNELAFNENRAQSIQNLATADTEKALLTNFSAMDLNAEDGSMPSTEDINPQNADRQVLLRSLNKAREAFSSYSSKSPQAPDAATAEASSQLTNFVLAEQYLAKAVARLEALSSPSLSSPLI